MLFKKKYPIGTIVQPVLYPPGVPPMTAFDVTYTIKNTGEVAGKIWAHLMQNGLELPLSKWTKNISVGGSVTATYHHPGITSDTTITIETGY